MAKEHGIFLASRMAAQNTDALNRNAIATEDLDNGWAVKLGALSKEADKTQVFEATKAGASDTSVYIVDDILHPVAYDSMGNGYDVGLKDPRKAFVPAGTVFAARKAQAGDIMKISANEVKDGTTGDFVKINPEGGYQFASTEGTGFVGKILENNYFSIGMMTDTLSNRVAAYLVEVVTN